jgi:hypothetical protein
VGPARMIAESLTPKPGIRETKSAISGLMHCATTPSLDYLVGAGLQIKVQGAARSGSLAVELSYPWLVYAANL